MNGKIYLRRLQSIFKIISIYSLIESDHHECVDSGSVVHLHKSMTPNEKLSKKELCWAETDVGNK